MGVLSAHHCFQEWKLKSRLPMNNYFPSHKRKKKWLKRNDIYRRKEMTRSSTGACRSIYRQMHPQIKPFRRRTTRIFQQWDKNEGKKGPIATGRNNNEGQPQGSRDLVKEDAPRKAKEARV